MDKTGIGGSEGIVTRILPEEVAETPGMTRASLIMAARSVLPKTPPPAAVFRDPEMSDRDLAIGINRAGTLVSIKDPDENSRIEIRISSKSWPLLK